MYQIHRPETKDFEKLVALANEADKRYFNIYTPEEAKEVGVNNLSVTELLETDRLLLAAYENDEPIGLTEYRFKTPNAVWVSSLFIRPDKQRQGIGKMLMLTIEDEAKTKGASAVVLEAEKNANWAVNFYNKLGYIVLNKEDFQQEPFLGLLSKDPVSNRFIFAKKV